MAMISEDKISAAIMY